MSRSQKLARLAGALTDGSSISPASSDTSLPGGRSSAICERLG